MSQSGFGFENTGAGFDFGGQSGFDFSSAESEDSRRRRDRYREEYEREQRERQQRERERERQQRQQQNREWSNPFTDWYAVLGLSPNATMDEVKKAHRRLAMQHHPDRGGDAATFRKIQEAFERITGKYRGRR
jgi:DnaJ-domain-containing protein 1